MDALEKETVLKEETVEKMKDQGSKAKDVKALEWAIFTLFVLGYLVVSSFHEPWYDEAEAWQMARGASFRDLLFSIPHYEGHPALWYLILAIPAKLGVPYEIGLKTVAGTAAVCYGWLMMFRSPFPKVVRCLLPFQYFFFYQYGVLARPYGVLVLLLCLMACVFPKRNEKPWRLIFLMMLLCALDAYGIVLAGGIAIAWVWEILTEKAAFTKLWKDRRVLSLLALLIFAILILLEIRPYADTYAMNSGSNTNSVILRLLYSLFVMLPDCAVLNVLQGSTYLSRATILLPILLVGILLGVLMLLAIGISSNGKNLKYFCIPYVLFGVFGSVVYLCTHHIGILLSFTIFWLWIAWEEPDRMALGRKLLETIKISETDAGTLKKIGIFLIGLAMAVSLYWTIAASVLEITNPYYFGREVADFLKENGLDQCLIMAEYDISAEGSEATSESIYEYVNTELVTVPVAILPYFEENICANLNYGNQNEGYALHRIPSAEENRKVMEDWKEMGTPEVILGPLELKWIYGDDIHLIDYARVYEFNPYANIWKANLFGYNIIFKDYVYVRKDLLEQYGLTEIPLSAYERFR